MGLLQLIIPHRKRCCNRRMQCATMSCFAPSTMQEWTCVLDCISAEARREIDRNVPPSV